LLSGSNWITGGSSALAGLAGAIAHSDARAIARPRADLLGFPGVRDPTASTIAALDQGRFMGLAVPSHMGFDHDIRPRDGGGAKIMILCRA